MTDEVGFDDIWYYVKREGFTLSPIDNITLLCFNEKVVYRWEPSTFSCFELSLVAYACLVEIPLLYN